MTQGSSSVQSAPLSGLAVPSPGEGTPEHFCQKLESGAPVGLKHGLPAAVRSDHRSLPSGQTGRCLPPLLRGQPCCSSPAPREHGVTGVVGGLAVLPCGFLAQGLGSTERSGVVIREQGSRPRGQKPRGRAWRGGAGAGGVTGLTLHNQREGLVGGEGRREAGKERGQSYRPEQLRETTGSRGPGLGHDAHPIPEARPPPQPQPRGPPRACFPHGWQVSGTASHPQPTVGAGGRKEWQGAPGPLNS